MDPFFIEPMTHKREFWQVGRVTRAQGLKGELYVSLRIPEASWLDKLTTLRLVRASGVEELDVVKARFHKHGLVVQTRQIQDRTQAEAYRGAVMEIPDAFLRSKPGENIYLREILDFEVYQTVHGGRERLGVVKDFGSNVAQDLLIVETKQGSVEIPMVAQFIAHIDFEQKTIDLDVPRELLDPKFWKG